MTTQARLDGKADKISAARDGGFTGIVVVPAQHQLRVYWKGQPAAPAKLAIAAAREGDGVQLVAARYSEAELLSAAKAVAGTAGVTGVAPNVDGSGLTVSVAPSARSAPIPSAVPIVRIDGAPQVASRGNDSAPYYGGSRWNGCSTGFGILQSGATRMLSAGHCADNGNYANDGGGDFMGTVGSDNNPYDRLLIGSSNTGTVFNGGVGSGEFTNSVIGALHSYVGDYVCDSGAYSGTTCREQVKAVNQTINVGYLIYQTVMAEQIDHTNALGNGDSGGPVEQVASDTTKVYAKGTNTAVDSGTSVACTGVPAGSGRVCGWRFYYVDVVNSLNAYGATILTNP